MQKRSFRVVGAPFELGSRTSGPAGAPDALRDGGLNALVESLSRRGISVSDLGDVAAPERGDSNSNPRHLKELLAYSEELVPRLIEVCSTGSCPIVIGGDHAVSIPSVSAAAAAIKKIRGNDAQLGLVWVDAHPDLETPETTPSGDLHGMAAATLLGFGAAELVELGGFSPKVLPENVAFIGLRDVLPCERELIESNGMRAYTATDINRLGIATICDQVFGHMSRAVSAFVLSFDVDACDPLEAPGVEYPERGGLTFREARLIGEYAADTAGLACVEVLEVIPELDREARSTQLAVSFLESVVAGKPVYRSGQPN